MMPSEDAAWVGAELARRDCVREILERRSGAWCPDQYHNPDNPAAYTALALELAG